MSRPKVIMLNSASLDGKISNQGRRHLQMILLQILVLEKRNSQWKGVQVSRKNDD